MVHRSVACFVVLLVALPLLTARDACAQYCIGTTGYIVRDETGKILGPEEMKNLTIKNINGVPTRLRPRAADGEPDLYECEITKFYENKFRQQTTIAVALANPLVFGVYSSLTSCGRVGDMTLVYGGKEMRLIFDIGPHNTYYEIDSLPFQEGTFHLRSLQCQDGTAPPLIDNNTTGKCRVSASNWEGMEKEWVRHVIWTGFWGCRIDPLADCHNQAIRVIDTHIDWVMAWTLIQAVNMGNPVPAVDFRTQVVLIIYMSNQSGPTLSYESIVVDTKGDLTFHPPPPEINLSNPKACNLLLVAIYRSGVRSIEGRPLPPPPAQSSTS